MLHTKGTLRNIPAYRLKVYYRTIQTNSTGDHEIRMGVQDVRQVQECNSTLKPSSNSSKRDSTERTNPEPRLGGSVNALKRTDFHKSLFL